MARLTSCDYINWVLRPSKAVVNNGKPVTQSTDVTSTPASAGVREAKDDPKINLTLINLVTQYERHSSNSDGLVRRVKSLPVGPSIRTSESNSMT